MSEPITIHDNPAAFRLLWAFHRNDPAAMHGALTGLTAPAVASLAEITLALIADVADGNVEAWLTGVEAGLLRQQAENN